MGLRASTGVSPAGGLHFDGVPTPVEVRRHPSARRLTLRVSRTRRAVILTVPLSSDLSEASRFVNRNLDWLRERLESVPNAAPFRDGATIPLRGDDHRLSFNGRLRTHALVTRAEATTGCLPTLTVGGLSEYAPRRLQVWLAEQARLDLAESVRKHAGRLGLAARGITIRDQKSRWGSCSSTGQLSFSWRLILAPSYVLDYVAAHEVAHLAEMNHGPRFWALVAKTLADMGPAKTWLTANGSDLHRYGVDG